MSSVDFLPKELIHLAYLSDAAIEDPASAIRMIGEAKKPSRELTPRYLGVLAVIQDVCIDEHGVLATRESIIREGLNLATEESIFHTAGYALVGAAELWLHRQIELTTEEQSLESQIASWRDIK